jgi:hypothetical protein
MTYEKRCQDPQASDSGLIFQVPEVAQIWKRLTERAGTVPKKKLASF